MFQIPLRYEYLCHSLGFFSSVDSTGIGKDSKDQLETSCVWNRTSIAQLAGSAKRLIYFDLEHSKSRHFLYEENASKTLFSLLTPVSLNLIKMCRILHIHFYIYSALFVARLLFQEIFPHTRDLLPILLEINLMERTAFSIIRHRSANVFLPFISLLICFALHAFYLLSWLHIFLLND